MEIIYKILLTIGFGFGIYYVNKRGIINYFLIKKSDKSIEEKYKNLLE